jgi:uncharacterized protein (UPF0332 family)
VRPEAARRFAKAERFLEQAGKLLPQEVPESTIHTSYYAMLHAAAALVIERTGHAPKSHGAVIGQFSQQVSSTDEGRVFGRALNRANTRRFVADYDDETIPSAASAAELRDLASQFVAYCRSLLTT